MTHNAKNMHRMLSEMFGDELSPVMGTKIGKTPGIAAVGAVGVRDLRDGVVCPGCGEMPIGGQCGCSDSDTCPMCGQMPPTVDASCTCGGLSEGKDTCDECGMYEDVCECGMNEAKKKKGGPSAKTARKILRGTKTFKDKMKKVEKWADNPAAAAAWMMHKATGKWPSSS